MNLEREPKFTVVGAGPGDPDLITLKAVKILQSADVVLYDALVNKEILKHVSVNAELHFVGKRKGYKRYSQEDINDLIVEFAPYFRQTRPPNQTTRVADDDIERAKS